MHRGGNGLCVAYRFLADGHIGIHDDRWLTFPWGVNGGKPGQRSTKILHRDGEDPQVVPAKCEGIKVKKGDLLYFNTWGGGGWGDPLERDPEQVLIDVNRRLVSTEGALNYGVVIKDNAVDIKETESLRKSMRSERSEPEMFDFGGDLDSIKSRCLEETQLEAPASPTFKVS